MKAKQLFFLVLAVILVVSFLPACQAQPTPTAVPPTEAPKLGSPEMPIVMAQAPSATTQELQAGGEAVAKKLSEMTGYTIKVTVPNSYAALIEAMGSGNAQIGWLPPLVYILAKQKGYADVALVAMRFGSEFYGVQFLANASGGFTPYFDPKENKNTNDDAAVALKQFEGKKPCFADPLSASGYVVPLAVLSKAGIKVQDAVFTKGHPQTVQTLYDGGVCDFGATYIDARTRKEFADKTDIMDKVVVIYRTLPIIPNDNVSIAKDVPADVKAKIVEALTTLSSTDDGKAILKAGGFDIEALKAEEDTFYDEFRVYLQSTGLDITKLVK